MAKLRQAPSNLAKRCYRSTRASAAGPSSTAPPENGSTRGSERARLDQPLCPRTRRGIPVWTRLGPDHGKSQDLFRKWQTETARTLVSARCRITEISLWPRSRLLSSGHGYCAVAYRPKYSLWSVQQQQRQKSPAPTSTRWGMVSGGFAELIHAIAVRITITIGTRTPWEDPLACDAVFSDRVVHTTAVGAGSRHRRCPHRTQPAGVQVSLVHGLPS